MKNQLSRRGVLTRIGGALAGVMTAGVARKAKAAVQKYFVSSQAPRGYEPTKHRWLMAIDIERCIGCGLCVEACKTENNVPRASTYFRTWVERYIIKKPTAASVESRGEVVVDSPNGAINGFPPTLVPREDILKAFHVPRLCNSDRRAPRRPEFRMSRPPGTPANTASARTDCKASGRGRL